MNENNYKTAWALRRMKGSLVIKMGMLILTSSKPGVGGEVWGTPEFEVIRGLRVIYDGVWEKKYKGKWKIPNKPFQLV